MPQSLAQVLLHVVFSTKDRKPFLQSQELREELHGYMIGTLQGIDCPSIIVRTVEDHYIRMNFGRYFAGTKLNSTNGTCGIEI
jgi:putative transposase